MVRKSVVSEMMFAAPFVSDILVLGFPLVADYVAREGCPILPGRVGIGTESFTPFGNYLSRLETGKVSLRLAFFSPYHWSNQRIGSVFQM